MFKTMNGGAGFEARGRGFYTPTVKKKLLRTKISLSRKQTFFTVFSYTLTTEIRTVAMITVILKETKQK